MFVVVDNPQTSFMESVDFVISTTSMKHPSDRAIVKLSFKNAFIRMRLLGSSI